MRTQIVTVLAVLSSNAMAHSGHDHAHWLSDPIHVVTVLSISAIALAGGYLVRKNKLSKTSIKED